MNFGKYVKILRKDNFLTQEEFANKLGVSRQTVSN
ncbi:MAG: helix-turn-helix transcriptional regulator [Bacilli bacterium]|nr:helix-turn-helix transcriptional regulator [Bacilli bacterium]MDY4618465.1 helix-turn-helix transcriptional regulator [Bacilli bacterium]